MLIGGCAYWSEKQGELIFRPSKDAWWGYSNAAVHADEHWIDLGHDGYRLNAWYLKADDVNAPALL